MPTITETDNRAREFTELLQFYVYVLIDPRYGSVFYVGEGQRERALNHVGEVRQLIAKGAALESAKHQTIKAILDSNLEPQTRVIARFDKVSRLDAELADCRIIIARQNQTIIQANERNASAPTRTQRPRMPSSHEGLMDKMQNHVGFVRKLQGGAAGTLGS